MNIPHKESSLSGRDDERRSQTRNLEALGTLAGGIGHNFNNLLMSIMGFTEMTQLELPDDHPCQKYLANILTSANQGKELVEQVMTFSGRTSQDKHPLRIGIILKEIVKSFQVLLPPTIKLDCSIKDKNRMLMAEPCQPYQIVTNLLDNAVNALGSTRGSIHLTLSILESDNLPDSFPTELPKGAYFSLTVEDNGPGMDKKTLDRVFEPFFIAGPNFQEKTGMGLPMVYGIVKDLQGHIHIGSRPGKGTNVHILLPTSTTISQIPTASQKGSHHGYGRILFIDDQSEIITWAKKSLTNLGYTVTATDRGDQALEWINQDPSRFDLVVTDLVMPGIEGLELITTINRIAPILPIVVCSGLNKKTATARIAGANVVEIVSKPFTMAEISRILAQALRAESPPHASGIPSRITA